MKQYVSDRIGDEYKEWGNRKIVINTPCASGKTVFILTVLVPYFRRKGKKMLLVCNRIALKEQYKKIYVGYCKNSEEEDYLKYATYQKMGREAYGQTRLPDEYYKYDIICFDEVHSLVEDDYNKTYYNLFNVICNTLSGKCLIFMSATLMRMNEYLHSYEKQRLLDGQNSHQMNLASMSLESRFQFAWYDDIPADYSYIDIVGVCDEKQLCECLLEDVTEANGQALVFSESKKQISRLHESLTKETAMKKSQVMVVDAQKMNDGTLADEREEMLKGERFPEGIKVVLSTKVLDNGITLRAEGEFSICALTDNQTEFIQMISRLRINPKQRVKLYVMEVQAKSYADRIKRMEKAKEVADKLKKQGLSPMMYDQINENEMTRRLLYITSMCTRKEITISKSKEDVFDHSIECGVELGQFINPFVYSKLKDDLFHLRILQSGAYNNPRILAEEQATWLGMSKDSIKWLGQGCFDENLSKFLQEKFNGIDSEEYKKCTAEFAKMCWKSPKYKPYIERRGASISQGKLKEICDSLDLVFSKEQNSDRKYVYTIKQK